MPVDVDKIFSLGGRELIDFLDYGVRAVQVDVLFLFLVQEYRLAPTTLKAVALYDAFCAPHALARISATELLPPAHLQIEMALRPLRVNVAQQEASRLAASVVPPLHLPAKFIFDAVVLHLRKKSPGLRAVKRRYNPRRTPLANLPGGRMNAGQRFFVEKVWEPKLRPTLIAAGFRRMSSIA